MTALQLEPSAQAPCTNTIFGSVVFTSSLPFYGLPESSALRAKVNFDENKGLASQKVTHQCQPAPLDFSYTLSSFCLNRYRKSIPYFEEKHNPVKHMGCAHDFCSEPVSRRAKHLPELGEDKPSPLLCYEQVATSSIVGAMACPRPGALTPMQRTRRCCNANSYAKYCR